MKIIQTLGATVVFLVIGAIPAFAAAPSPIPRDSVYQLQVSLTDQDGQRHGWRDMRGKPRVVAMFYSACPYMCPLIVDGEKSVFHALSIEERSKLGFVLITMDPERDTPVKLKALAVQRDLHSSAWSLMSPAPDDVRAIAGLLGVRYRKLANGDFNHTSELILLDAQGRVLARTEQIGSIVDPVFVKAVRSALSNSP